MNIREELSELDEYGLELAAGIAKKLLKERRESEKVRLWSVGSLGVNEKFFKEDQFDIAVGFLCEQIRKRAKDKPNKCIEISLMSENVPVCKLDEYIAL